MSDVLVTTYFKLKSHEGHTELRGRWNHMDEGVEAHLAHIHMTVDGMTGSHSQGPG